MLVSCQEEPAYCPEIWSLNRNEISSSAKIDSSQLFLEAWNSASVNSIALSQTGLVGDFEVSINLLGLEWDSLVSPQFRLEVFDENDSSFPISGVAVNPDVFYCYVGSSPDAHDLRFINQNAGTLKIKRTEDQIECIGIFGDVSLTYAAEIPKQDVSVRLVLGTTSSSVGRAAARVGYFEASYDDPNNSHGPSSSTSLPNTGVASDYFSCETW